MSLRFETACQVGGDESTGARDDDLELAVALGELRAIAQARWERRGMGAARAEARVDSYTESRAKEVGLRTGAMSARSVLRLESMEKAVVSTAVAATVQGSVG